MTIFLKGGGLLKDYLKPDVDEYTRKVETEEGKSINEIIEQIKLKPSLVSMVILSGKIVPMSYTPAEGDIITLRPPVQGG
jgi:hypothetical protein